jgi:hypothetical protein
VTDGDVVPLHLVWFFEMTFGGQHGLIGTLGKKMMLA